MRNLETISHQIFDSTSELESFVHQTLRPVLKFQNEVLVRVSVKQVQKFQKDFQKSDLKKQQKSISEILVNDLQLKNTLLGVVIGQFKPFELTFYLEHESDLKKRIFQMIEVRILSQFQQFL
jgi:hypothetical protein